MASRGVANWGRERNGFECYADGHMGNNNCDFSMTQRTGLSPNNWGYGRISSARPVLDAVRAADEQQCRGGAVPGCTQPEPPWWAYDDVYEEQPVWAATLTVSRR